MGQGADQHEPFSDLLTFWSPTVNLARDPRWGRTPETYGEDPFLTGRIGAAFVRGLQGDDPRYLKVVSTPKHFTANNEEHNRFECDARISEKDLREYYLASFEACIKEGKAQSVMTAYNAVNGVPCTVNPWLITKVLRGEWGFDGYVVSDCGAPNLLVTAHHYVKTPEAAATLAIKAGLDLECGDYVFDRPLAEAYRLGMVTDADIDSAAFHVLRARMRLGLFDDPAHNPYSSLTPAVIAAPSHQLLALQAARESIVLLKNQRNFLPLRKGRLHQIAVLGINADKCIFGDYSGTPVIEPVSVLQGIRDKVGKKTRVVHVPWDRPLDEALEAARRSDVVVAVMGSDLEVERETLDRTDIALSEAQQSFLKAVYGVNPHIALVLVAGSSLALSWEQATLPAIVDAWYPGESGGTAVADVLFGDYNPAGRLPLTFYASLDDLPAFDDYSLAGRTYQYFEGDPVYPFGHGLSYTSFRYEGLAVHERGDTLLVDLKLRNTGSRDGDEVVQVYVTLPESAGEGRPLRQLKGFRRVHVPAGKTRSVQIALPREQLRCWDGSAGRFAHPAGTYRLQVGASSEDIRLRQDIDLPPYDL